MTKDDGSLTQAEVESRAEWIGLSFTLLFVVFCLCPCLGYYLFKTRVHGQISSDLDDSSDESDSDAGKHLGRQYSCVLQCGSQTYLLTDDNNNTGASSGHDSDNTGTPNENSNQSLTKPDCASSDQDPSAPRDVVNENSSNDPYSKPAPLSSQSAIHQSVAAALGTHRQAVPGGHGHATWCQRREPAVPDAHAGQNVGKPGQTSQASQVQKNQRVNQVSPDLVIKSYFEPPAVLEVSKEGNEDTMYSKTQSENQHKTTIIKKPKRLAGGIYEEHSKMKDHTLRSGIILDEHKCYERLKTGPRAHKKHMVDANNAGHLPHIDIFKNCDAPVHASRVFEAQNLHPLQFDQAPEGHKQIADYDRFSGYRFDQSTNKKDAINKTEKKPTGSENLKKAMESKSLKYSQHMIKDNKQLEAAYYEPYSKANNKSEKEKKRETKRITNRLEESKLKMLSDQVDDYKKHEGRKMKLQKLRPCVSDTDSENDNKNKKEKKSKLKKKMNKSEEIPSNIVSDIELNELPYQERRSIELNELETKDSESRSHTIKNEKSKRKKQKVTAKLSDTDRETKNENIEVEKSKPKKGEITWNSLSEDEANDFPKQESLDTSPIFNKTNKIQDCILKCKTPEKQHVRFSVNKCKQFIYDHQQPVKCSKAPGIDSYVTCKKTAAAEEVLENPLEFDYIPKQSFGYQTRQNNKNKKKVFGQCLPKRLGLVVNTLDDELHSNSDISQNSV